MKILWLLLWVGWTAHADLIRLQDGTTVTGEIREESATEIRIETEIAGGTIVRTETIPKDQIAEIQRWTPTQKQEWLATREFEKLAKYQLSPKTSGTVAGYNQVIDGVFRKFLRDYPESVHVPKVKAQLALWEAERDKVAAGQVKFEGEWLSKAEYDQQKLRDQVRVLSQQGEQALQQRRWPQAAAAYESLIQLNPKGATLDIARRQLVVALADWQQAVEQAQAQSKTQLAQAEQKLKVAQQRVADLQARTAGTHSQAKLSKNANTETSGETSGKLGVRSAELSVVMSELVQAQADLKAAEQAVAPLRAQAEAAQRQLAEIQQRIARNQIQNEFAAATAPTLTNQGPGTVPTATPSTPGESTDVLEHTASWWTKNWLWLAGAALLGLFLLSRLTR
jgi:hypothetical protein